MSEVCKTKQPEETLRELHLEILQQGDADIALWQTILAFQEEPFFTSSGLPFSYTVKRGKNGEYTGELIISRKEGSKTVTKSSILLAFHTVRDALLWGVTQSGENIVVYPEYKGPKAIGQIFGISYIYSLFWNWGLIRVPEKVAENLRCSGKAAKEHGNSQSAQGNG